MVVNDTGVPIFVGDRINGEVELIKQDFGNQYKKLKVEPVKFIVENKLEFLEGEAIKRISTHHLVEDGKEEIEKAIQELKLILKYKYKDHV